MTTEIMKSFSSLQDELEKAKDNLKAMDEHIKKLTGRDPGELPMRPGLKRPANPPEEFRGRGRGFPIGRGRPGARLEEEEQTPPAAKKRPGDTRTVFSRLSGPPAPKRGGDSDAEDELPNKPVISSRVIAPPKEPPSRQEAMAAQSSDQRSYERNRRMFGALLGTLQKFRQEETRMREKEEKRAKVERKLEENAKREKEELKRERQELFVERKRKQAEIRKIELKMLRIKEQDEWEAKHRNLLNFIQTRSKPHIFYLPKTHNPKTEERLVASQKVVAKMIEKKRSEVRQELEAIERRGRWRQGLASDAGDDHEHEQVSDEEAPTAGDKENRLGMGRPPQGPASVIAAAPRPTAQLPLPPPQQLKQQQLKQPTPMPATTAAATSASAHVGEGAGAPSGAAKAVAGKVKRPKEELEEGEMPDDDDDDDEGQGAIGEMGVAAVAEAETEHCRVSSRGAGMEAPGAGVEASGAEAATAAVAAVSDKNDDDASAGAPGLAAEGAEGVEVLPGSDQPAPTAPTASTTSPDAAAHADAPPPPPGVSVDDAD